jgi:hypothetical protein
MHFVAMRKVSLLMLFTAALLYPDDSSIVGTWTATMHGLPAIRMTVRISDGKLSGNIIFYMLIFENGAWKVNGEDATEMIEPRMEDQTFVFEVPHAKKHGSTDPADQEIKIFRLQVVGPNEAVFKNADNGQDLKLTRLK